jgi:hypothetical protein
VTAGILRSRGSAVRSRPYGRLVDASVLLSLFIGWVKITLFDRDERALGFRPAPDPSTDQDAP